jgi:HAD superfamily hydrolase (TIGR01484 family)
LARWIGGFVKSLLVFDLDGTLAASKSPISAELADLVYDLLGVVKVSIISGGSWDQFERQLLVHLPVGGRLSDLHLLPTCGTQLFEYRGSWKRFYFERFSASQRDLIIECLERALEESGEKVERTWGEAIEDRGSQITLSVLGQEAPLSNKQAWDPDFAKRKKILAILVPLLEGFSVRMGGTTSIDVTPKGVDKAYGVRKLQERLGISMREILFVGDAIFEGGNDYAVQAAGVDSIQVRDPSEAARVIQTAIACLGDGSTQIKSPGRVAR